MVLAHSTLSENMNSILKNIKKTRNVRSMFIPFSHRNLLNVHTFFSIDFRIVFSSTFHEKWLHVGGHFVLVTFFGPGAKMVPGTILVTFLAPFWAPFGSLWTPFGSLWLPLAPFCLALASLWLPFGSLWLTFTRLGAPFSHFWPLLALFFCPFPILSMKIS